MTSQDPGDVEMIDEPVMTGYIYRLDGEGRFYIGSTNLTPEERLAEHVRKSRKTEHFAVHRYFGEVGWDKVRISVIRIMTSTVRDLRRAEGEVIETVINDPACLNENRTGRYETPAQRHARAYPIGRGLPILCTCGETIIQCQMETHLASEQHLRDTILTTTEPSVEEMIAERSETCKCGDRVLRRTKAVHESCARHKLKMRIKRCRLSDLHIAVPAILDPTPEGYDVSVPWCQCPCGAITRYHQFGQHERGLKHLQAMFDRGLIKESSSETSEEVSDKIKCRCGEMIHKTHAYTHEQTKKHKVNLRKLESLNPEITEDTEEDVVDESDEEHPPEPTWKTAARRLVACEECGAMITAPNMPKHKTTTKHRDRIERKRLGLPEPVLKTLQRGEPMTCGCGSTFIKSGLRQHETKKKHINWQAKQITTAE